MDTYRIAIDTFIAEAFECRASVCAIFTGTDIDKSELHLMAGSTVLSVPLASILSIEKLVFPDIQTVEYEISTKEGGTITVDVF